MGPNNFQIEGSNNKWFLSLLGDSRGEQLDGGGGGEGAVYEADGGDLRRHEALSTDTTTGIRAQPRAGQGAALVPLQAQDGRRRVQPVLLQPARTGITLHKFKLRNFWLHRFFSLFTIQFLQYLAGKATTGTPWNVWNYSKLVCTLWIHLLLHIKNHVIR